MTPQELYNDGKITADQCFERMVLIRTMPVDDVSPRFVKLLGARKNERELLRALSVFPLPAVKIKQADIRVRVIGQTFAASYSYKKMISYPGTFESRTAAMMGVEYLMYAINKEIEKRRNN